MTGEIRRKYHNQNDIEVAKIIHDSIIDMYQIEWQRTRDIESKATGIVGFVGIIFSLTIASLSTIVSSADEAIKEEIFSAIYLHILIFSILVLMTLSILCGIIALNVKEWWYLIAEDFVSYCNKEIRPKKDLHTKITEETTEIIIKNRNQNKQIANWLKRSYILFMASIIVLMFYFIQLLSILK